MPNITVNPTRMELTRLKGKLRTAQRGHKLLKDKRDELMKQFLDTVREVRALRQEVEEELMTVHGAFTVASALMSSQALEDVYKRQNQRRELPFHKMLLNGQLPQSIGGGIGQSRLCMLLIGTCHIGEVQVSLWDADTMKTCEDAGITLL